MKNAFAITFVLVLSLAAMKSIANEEVQPVYVAEAENISVRTVGQQPMVAPSKNEQAMLAYRTGSQLLFENKLDDAEKHLREAIKLDPLFVDAMDHLGMVFRRQNRLDEAENSY